MGRKPATASSRRTNDEESSHNNITLKNLQANLNTLQLDIVPSEWINHVFNTGGLPFTETLNDMEWYHPDLPSLLRLSRAMARWNDDTNSKKAFWETLLAIEVEGDNVSYKAWCTVLFRLLQSSSNSTRSDLNKALVAARIYLLWLQFDGASAYGIWMPLMYREVLRVIQRWCERMYVSSTTSSTNKKRGSADDDNDDNKGEKATLSESEVHYGTQLMESWAAFATYNDGLRSLPEARAYTIDIGVTLMCLLTVGKSPLAKDSELKLHNVLLSVGSSCRGAVFRRLRPVMSVSESLSVNGDAILSGKTKAAVACQKEAISVILGLQAAGNKKDDDALLCLLQHLCQHVPERADARNQVAIAIETLALAPSGATLDDRRSFVSFLYKVSQLKKSVSRVFAVQISTLFLRKNEFYTDPQMLGTLMRLLIGRSSDKVSTVRAKAISALSSLLLQGLSPESNDVELELGVALRNFFSESNGQLDALEELLKLFRTRLTDEKILVRRAAVQALEIILLLRADTKELVDTDVNALHARCADTSVMVRNQAITTLTSILIKYPENLSLQRCWNNGVLPLAMDREMSVQAKALDSLNRALFNRVISWSSKMNEDSCLWQQLGQINGIMIRCLQKGIRQLIRASKLDVKKLLNACEKAVSQSKKDTTLVGQWSFAWWALEELAHGGQLVGTVKSNNVSFIIDCWHEMEQSSLPATYLDGSQRILNVLKVLAPVIRSSDAQKIATSVETQLMTFNFPTATIPAAVSALYQLHLANATDKSTESATKCFTSLLNECEDRLASFVMAAEATEGANDLERPLFTIGEVALVGFDKDDDKSKEGYKIALMEIPKRIVSVVSSFLSTTVSSSNDTTLPSQVRAVAFLSLGKLCLRDEELAKECISMFVRELKTSSIVAIRSNALMILGDLCVRYTSLVDLYIPSMASSILDSSALVRRHGLMLMSQLILQDYIKWRGDLLFYFLIPLADKDSALRELAGHVLSGPLLLKTPNLFTNKFIDVVFVLNGLPTRAISALTAEDSDSATGLALCGDGKNRKKRNTIYKFLLQHQVDEQKIQVSAKLVSEILEDIVDGELKFPDCEPLIVDTLSILQLKEIKIAAVRDNDTNDAEEDIDLGGSAADKVAAQLAKAKGKLLSSMLKKNFVENVVPVVIALKALLEKQHSPCMRSLMAYIKDLFKQEKDQVKEILSADPRLVHEVEYDIRKYEEEAARVAATKPADVLNESVSRNTPAKSARKLPRSAVKTPRMKTTKSQLLRTTPRLSSKKSGQKQTPKAFVAKTPASSRSVLSELSQNNNSTTNEEVKTMLFSPAAVLESQTKKWNVSVSDSIISKQEMSEEEEEPEKNTTVKEQYDALNPKKKSKSEKKRDVKKNSVPLRSSKRLR